MSEIKRTVVTFEEMEDIDFVVPATFFIRNAMGEFVYYHTSSREKAQKEIDKDWGVGRYTAMASKLQKTKSKLESGGLSCTGTQTRRGQKK